MNDSLKSEENKVRGCQSQVWLSAELKDGHVRFQADSDAQIVKGLISILLKIYNDRTPQEILKTPPDFVEKLGLNTNLSQTRANGLASMIKQIKFFAIAFSLNTSNHQH
jgi:cysteine desulfuration protein SufE